MFDFVVLCDIIQPDNNYNSEMNDFFLSLSACSCIYIVSQYIAQINTTRHLCKQHFEDQREAIHSFR